MSIKLAQSVLYQDNVRILAFDGMISCLNLPLRKLYPQMPVTNNRNPPLCEIFLYFWCGIQRGGNWLSHTEAGQTKLQGQKSPMHSANGPNQLTYNRSENIFEVLKGSYAHRRSYFPNMSLAICCIS